MIKSIKNHLLGFILCQFLSDSKGVPSQISDAFSKCHFISILKATDHGFRPRLFSTDVDVYGSCSPSTIKSIKQQFWGITFRMAFS
ncbi:unnamed protein product [Linum trigynum]|uniref:Uncharacterized protein n=1 Tax=Linum trigynum TaxID=586398 RepID=A0AAV2GV81_9ROSI